MEPADGRAERSETGGCLPLPLLIAVMIAGPLWAALRTWLIHQAVWPADCVPNLSTGRRRSINIYLEQLDCSPGLLAGDVVEWATFAVLWSLPLGLVALALALHLNWRRRWRELERPR